MQSAILSKTQSLSFERKAGKFIGVSILTVLSAIFIIPFIWSLSASFKDLLQIYAIPHKWIPNPIYFENYANIFELLPLARFFLNTVIITSLSLIGNIFSCSLVAYSFARLRWRGKHVLFIILLSTTMLPSHVTLIPQFLIFQKLGWHDTYLPLIVPHWLAVSVFNVFLLRQFFLTIPLELEDAAKIDGCSFLRIFFQIMIPLAKPAMATITILSFIGHWNMLLLPLIYLQSYEKFPIAVGINMFKDMYSALPHYVMAASMLSLIPILILFFLAQKQFVKGIMLSGIKG
ncbi:carbohydrate ABC transporter permease [candidate division KSB1 bacterium]|nr:carbohydrate ABC transporter permease [candidate division KSB1 bacterium]